MESALYSETSYVHAAEWTDEIWRGHFTRKEMERTIESFGDILWVDQYSKDN